MEFIFIPFNMLNKKHDISHDGMQFIAIQGIYSYSYLPVHKHFIGSFHYGV